MKTRIFLTAIIITLGFLSGWANNDNPANRTTINKFHSTSVNTTTSVSNSNIENWLFSFYQIPTSSTVVIFDVQELEFLEYCSMNDINSLTIKFFSADGSGTDLQLLASETIPDVFDGFNASTWSHMLTNTDPVSNYYFQIIINETICGDILLLPTLEEDFPEEEVDLPIELPEFTCGESYTYDENTNMNPLLSAEAGDIFYIGGFPILVQSISGTSGTFSGTGIIPIPFKRKVLSVEFFDVSVNTDRVIYDGDVVGRTDSPSNYPDFNPTHEPLNIGGDICLPEPPPPSQNANGTDTDTGLDEWGFDPNTGIHSGTMGEYDFNGFDIDGIHKDTETTFNEEDCNREGVDINGNPCDPTGGPNPEADAYAESIQSTLGATIETILNNLETELTTNLANTNCAAIRGDMDDLVGVLQYSRTFLFGEGDKYFNEGMHLEFEQEPQKLAVNIDRDPNAVLLEEKHIELYHCDKEAYKFDALLTAITAMIAGLPDETLLNEILDKIRAWGEFEYSEYSNDADKFQEWLIREIGNIMQTNSGLDDSYTAVENNNHINDVENARKSIQSIFDFNPNSPYNTAIASNEKSFLVNEGFTLEDAAFYYLQGHKEINGFHRALFMEEMNLRRRFTSNESNNLLPVCISKTAGNRSYTIYLDAITFTQTGASVDAYAIIEDPETGKKIVFEAENLSFGPTGLDSNSSSKLFLGTDVEIRLNNAAMLILKGTPDTYVEWDCEGFQSIGIDAQVEFCRNFITPLDPSTLDPVSDENERYRVDITTTMTSWLEFVFEFNSSNSADGDPTSLQPFAVTKFSDIKWTLKDLVLDFSSDYTPEFEPLEGYTSPFWDQSANTMLPTWKGFYMGELDVTFPNSFSNNNQPVMVEASKILIDGHGFTGAVEVTDLITIDNGSIAGWPFSINSFQVNIIKNKLSGAGFSGEVGIPIFEEHMGYEATFSEGNNYNFVVTPTETVTMDMFLATGEIYDDSTIDIKYKDGDFVATAVLNGKIDVGITTEDAPVNVNTPSMCFQGLQVSNQAPYIKPGTWGLVTENNNTGATASKMSGFDIRLSKVAGFTPRNPNEAGVNINLDLILSNNIDICAGGGFDIIGKLMTDNGRQKWEFKEVKMKSFYVDADFSAASIKGQLQWYEDEVTADGVDWGKGFQGAISADFKKIDFSIDAVAQFGKLPEYKYFFVDALADISGLTKSAGAITINGFGGGVSYNMDTDHVQVDLSSSSNNSGGLLPLGVSLSGTEYTPNDDVGLGLKATVLIASAKEEVFNGMVSFSILFNGSDNGGGINKINLTGSGQFLQPLDFGIEPIFTSGADEAPSSVQAKLSCFINLEYNFNEPSFHGDINVFLNAGKITGSLPGGKVVDAALHFDKEKWYIYIGRPEPENQCGITFTLPGGIGAIKANGYLDIGTVVPPMAALPSRVSEIAGGINTNASERSSGTGFAMGASLTFNATFKKGSRWTAEVAAGTGFDVMIRDYGNASCSGSSGQLGIDGWYARGQLWAYISGVVKRNGKKKAEVAGAFILEASLPNPFWLRGRAGFRVNLGPFNFNGNFDVEIGDACNVSPLLTSNTATSRNSNTLGMDVIAFMVPTNGITNVPTSSVPKIYFNVDLDKDYIVQNTSGSTTTYRTELLSVSLTSQDGYDIAGQVEYNSERSEIYYRPLTFLPAKDNLTLQVEVRVYKDGVFLEDESKYISFDTADELDYIPQNNIAASYPVQGMVNYYKQEYNAGIGYIYLKSGQHDLFYNIPSGFEQKIRLTATDNTVQFIDFDYNSLDNKITFPLDPTLLQNEMLYRLELIQLAEGEAQTENSDDTTPTSTLDIALSNPPSTSAGGPSPSDNTGISEAGVAENTSILYTLHFRVSKYNTFKEKITAINAGQTGISKNIASYELFDMTEASGENPLVAVEVDLNNDWINDSVKEKYEALKIYACDDAKALNDERAKDIPIICLEPASPSLSSVDFDNGVYNFEGNDIINLDLETVINNRFKERQSKAEGCPTTIQTIDFYLENCASINNCAKAEELMTILTEDLAPLSAGTYKALIYYKIPSKNGSITTTATALNFTKYAPN